MAAAQNGDAAAYRKLLESLTPVLRRYFRRRSSNGALVEDLCQETLLSIHRARHTFLTDQPFGAWAMTIARNAWIDSLRKIKRRSEFESTVEEIPQVAADTPWQGEGDLEAEALLAQLPAGQREAVRLTKLEGLPVEAAARKLGISESALKVRVHRALQLLKKTFLVEAEE